MLFANLFIYSHIAENFCYKAVGYFETICCLHSKAATHNILV